MIVCRVPLHCLEAHHLGKLERADDVQLQRQAGGRYGGLDEFQYTIAGAFWKSTPEGLCVSSGAQEDEAAQRIRHSTLQEVHGKGAKGGG